MIDQARVVVIGGGITGCSVLYHLAKAGLTDAVLLEKGELTSGATCQAAGMLTQFNTSPTIMRMRKYSVGLYRELKAYGEVGSVNIASSPEMLKTLQRNVSRARGIGLDVGIISPERPSPYCRGPTRKIFTAQSMCPETAISIRTRPPMPWPRPPRPWGPRSTPGPG